MGKSVLWDPELGLLLEEKDGHKAPRWGDPAGCAVSCGDPGCGRLDGT